MSKIKIIKPHHRFWTKVFNYIIENKIEDSFGFIFYIVVTPSNFLNASNSLKKELKKINQLLRNKELKGDVLLVASVLYTFDYYTRTKRILKQTDKILETLYNNILIDYKKATPIKEVPEEIIKKRINLASPIISPISYFIINSILENKNQEKVNELLLKLKQEEEKEDLLTTTYKESTIIDLALQNALPKGDLLAKEIKNIELDEESMLKILHAKYEKEKLLLPKPILKVIIGLIRVYLIFNEKIKELQNQIQYLKEYIDELHLTFRKEMNLFFEEHNELIEQLHILQSKKEITKLKKQSKEIAQVEKYELEIAELKAKINNLQEEKEYQSTIIEKLKEQLIPKEEKLKPLSKKIKIAYFGLPNPTLEIFLSKYNINIQFFSSINFKQDIPNMPIVFNIDVANHKVFNLIKGKKPLLVSGSNAEKLGKIIIEWVERI